MFELVICSKGKGAGRDTAVAAVERKEASAKKTTSQFINEIIIYRPKQGKEETTTLKVGKENENGEE